MVAVRGLGLARGLHRGLWAGLLLAVCWTASVLVPLRLVADSYLSSHNADTSSDLANESSQQSSSAVEPVWNRLERGDFSSGPREPRRLGKASSGAATRSILMWNRFYEEPNLGFPLPRGWSLSRAAPCHPTPCVFASRAALRARTPPAHAASHFDAVVVRMRDGRLPDGFPPPARSPRQRFVFFRLEPPQYSGRAPGLRGVFNWTMSYRLDSDVRFPYGEVVARPGARLPARGWLRPAAPPPSPPQVDALLRARPRPSTPPSRANGRRERAVVAWMASRCESASRREEYVRRLQRHLPVDVFGRCGSGYWPRNNTMGFYRMLARRYKFYLSFENSLCKDYVTEKFFSILHLPVVPVVLGGANYSAVAPPDSYINARAFPSPRALARYLRYLAGAPRDYAKFFWWKRYYRVVTAAPATLCRLCDALLKEPLPGQRTHEDVEAWWHEPGVCETPREDEKEDNEDDDDDDDDEDDGASSALFSEENMLQGYFEAATP